MNTIFSTKLTVNLFLINKQLTYRKLQKVDFNKWIFKKWNVFEQLLWYPICFKLLINLYLRTPVVGAAAAGALGLTGGDGGFL